MNKTREKGFDFLGLNFHGRTMASAMAKLEDLIREGAPSMIFTPTAELIVRAHEDRNLKQIYNNADLLTLDSFVVYYAARLFGKQVKEPVSAVRLMFNSLKIIHEKGYKLYLLGAKEEVVNKTVSTFKEKYPGINIVGWRNGYFDFNNAADVINDIKDKKPDILFVAMSSPLKEEFISKNINKMMVPVSMGVGGSFDIIAGACQLAPEWVSKAGLEWLYRLIQEPRRLWKRYLITNIKFLCLMIKEFFKTVVKSEAPFENTQGKLSPKYETNAKS